MVLAVKERNKLIQPLSLRAPLPNLSLSIRNLLLNEITSDVLDDLPLVKELAKRIRREIDIVSLTKYEAFTHVAGVDAGSQIIPLASRQYGIISALAYGIPSGHRFFLDPESFSQAYSKIGDGFRSVVNVRREAKLYETAVLYLDERPETDLVLIDGPLAFSNWWKNAGEEKDRQRLIDAVNRLLKKCREMDVTVAGIVKRPSARYLIHYLGLQNETDLPDSFLLLQALRQGERTDIFSPKTALRMAARNSPFMDAVRDSIYSFYCRLTSEWNLPPIRVDIPAFCLGRLDDVASYCYATSFYGGIPLAIVKADEEVKVTRRFISDIYMEILTRVSRESGEMSQLAPYWGEGEWMGV
ncbi:MAG: DNA double-strand break repair nuclease NurA [Candidatus Bathyarchaeota archaeon]|nr:DNA double-strand break repair nuclease NurA [Candidatus Bathyarchaeota archaeon]